MIGFWETIEESGVLGFKFVGVGIEVFYGVIAIVFICFVVFFGVGIRIFRYGYDVNDVNDKNDFIFEDNICDRFVGILRGVVVLISEKLL